MTLEHHRLSPTELRILLRLSEREATASQLAEELAEPVATISHARRCLSMRGLVRHRFAGAGSASQLVFDITPAGLRRLEPLIQLLATADPNTEAQR